MTTLETTGNPNPLDLTFLGERLAEFNDRDVGASGKQALAVFARDASDAIVGGISGYAAWGWLYVQWLWIAESSAGKASPARCWRPPRRRHARTAATAAYIETFNQVALKVYGRGGYEPFGELRDFPLGRTRTFLQKAL